MGDTSTRNSLYLPLAADGGNTFYSSIHTNFETVDSAISKCRWDASAAPTADDDDGDGYMVGSIWVDTTNHAVYFCEDATTSSAVWRQIWPMAAPGADFDFGAYEVRAQTFESDVATGTAPFTIASATMSTNLNADLLDGEHASAFTGTSHDHAGGDGAAIAAGATTFTATSRILGRKTASAGAGEECTITDILGFLGTVEQGDVIYYNGATFALLPHGTSGQVLQSGGHAANPSWADGGTGSAAFWTEFPGTPTRVSDSQFTITDTSNANSYNKIFTKGTVIKWEKSGGGFQCAMIKAAAYDSNTVTINILGNDLAADFTDMKYCIHRAEEDVFIVPGTMPGNTATADISKTVYATCDLLVFAAQVRYKTAPTTTKGVWDINDDATTIFTTKPEIAASATTGTEQISDCILDTALTVVAKDSAITLDYDSGHATTPGADAYVTFWWMPESWRYQS